MTPVFLSKGVKAKEFRAVGDGSHLRIVLTNIEETVSFVAIGFGLADKKTLLEKGQPFDIVYQLEENIWNGRASIQMRIKDIQ